MKSSKNYIEDSSAIPENALDERVMAVQVSSETHKKAVRLHKFVLLSSLGKGVWGNDQRLLKCNLLLVPNSINYAVLLAMGRSHRHALKTTLE